MKPKKPNKILFQAVREGSIGKVQVALAAGADPNARDHWQATPLHWAAARGHADLARLLIEKGAEPNAKDNWQQTPLHYAAERDHTDLVKMLEDAANGILPTREEAKLPSTDEKAKADRWQRVIEEVRRKVKAGITDPNEVGF